MCIVSTVSSLTVVGNVSVCGVNKVDLKKKKKNVEMDRNVKDLWLLFNILCM